MQKYIGSSFGKLTCAFTLAIRALLFKATYTKYFCHKRETTTYHCQWSKRNIETIVKLSSEDITAISQIL